MTLDVTIGEVIKCSFEEVLTKLLESYTEYGETLVVDTYPLLNVERCPDAEENICDPEWTVYPNSAYRSGSVGFWQFFSDCLPEIYATLRNHPRSNDRDIALIRPVLDKINALPMPADPAHADRMKWLKYWCNKAVELYGDRAAIQFT